MADDLLSLTLQLCGKKEDVTPRFPRLLYDGYVTEIVRSAVTIQRDIIAANEIKRSQQPGERARLQREACEYCVWLVHMIRVAKDNGWISEKQRTRWSKLTTSLKWKVVAWMKSDLKYMGQP